MTEVNELLCYSQTVMYILFGCRDQILERDVTILVNVLFEFLRCEVYVSLSHVVHPIPAVKASVEHIILNGICQYLSESHITITSTIINRFVSNYENGADLPSEIVALTAAQLLARILPILGEAIKAQLDELLGSLLPALEKDSVLLQTTVIRSLVQMGLTDASIIEVMIKQLVLHLDRQLSVIRSLTEESQRREILQCDVLTGYCKAIGELLILLYTSEVLHFSSFVERYDISFDLLSMLFTIAKELLTLYHYHTESDYRQNSLTGNQEAFRVRQIYQYCSEAGWYLIQGLVSSGFILMDL